jgi:hypothetical protein
MWPKCASGSGVQAGLTQLDGASAIHSAESVSGFGIVSCFSNDAPAESFTSASATRVPETRTSAVTTSPGRMSTAMSTALDGYASYHAE